MSKKNLIIRLIFGLTLLLLLIILGCGTLSQYDIDSARDRINRDREPQAPRIIIPGK